MRGGETNTRSMQEEVEADGGRRARDGLTVTRAGSGRCRRRGLTRRLVSSPASSVCLTAAHAHPLAASGSPSSGPSCSQRRLARLLLWPSRCRRLVTSAQHPRLVRVLLDSSPAGVSRPVLHALTQRSASGLPYGQAGFVGRTPPASRCEKRGLDRRVMVLATWPGQDANAGVQPRCGERLAAVPAP